MVTAKKTVSEKPAKKPAAKKPAAVKHVAEKKAVAHHETAAKAAPAAVSTASGYHKALGRRKEATARVRLIPGGKGNIVVNGRAFEDYFCVEWQRQSILAPLIAVGENDSYDITAKIEGGGMTGQATALQHAISRALLLVNPDYRKTLRRAGYLTRDPRAKERKKPGLKRARKRAQWAKR